MGNQRYGSVGQPLKKSKPSISAAPMPFRDDQKEMDKTIFLLLKMCYIMG